MYALSNYAPKDVKMMASYVGTRNATQLCIFLCMYMLTYIQTYIHRCELTPRNILSSLRAKIRDLAGTVNITAMMAIIHLQVLIYIYACVCMAINHLQVCVYAYVHTYMHTYIHTYIQAKHPRAPGATYHVVTSSSAITYIHTYIHTCR